MRGSERERERMKKWTRGGTNKRRAKRKNQASQYKNIQNALCERVFEMLIPPRHSFSFTTPFGRVNTK